jgi:heme-degrading monooxygenase HmoA
MKKDKILSLFIGLATLSCISPIAPTIAQTESPSVPTQANPSTQGKKVVARIWHGRTLATKADEYYDYLVEAGIKKIESIPGNLGVQVLRRNEGKTTEFTVISYWESRDAIRKFAGNNIEKVRPLPKDNEYLIKPETIVKHFDVMLDSRK